MRKKRAKKTGTMKRAATLTAPTRPTVKRLFAVSGNRCAFKRCATPIVDTQSGSILGEICHIKGEKPTAKRFDASQTATDRHGFDNLILLCPAHHKIIDDDDDTYTVEVLTKMKTHHETKRPPEKADNQLADKLIRKFNSNTHLHGSIITSQRQAGGQVAHSINNIFNESAPTDDRITIEGQANPFADLKVIRQFGTVGVQLTVINRGNRPARIASAQFCIEGKGFVAAFEKGFGYKFAHDPPPGLETETLYVSLFPLAKKHCSDGFVLQRDDVCRFFLPLGPHIGPALKARQDAVYFRVEFFDKSREILLRGKAAKEVVRDCVKAYEGWPYKPRRTLAIGVEVAAKTLPKIDFNVIGKTNPNGVWFGKPTTGPKPPKPGKLEIQMGFAVVKDQWTLVIRLRRLPARALDQLKVVFCVVEHSKKTIYTLDLPRVVVSKEEREAAFVIPVEHRDKAMKVAQTFGLDLFWLAIIVGKVEVVRITGDELRPVFAALAEQKLGQAGGVSGVGASPPPVT